MFLSFNPWLLLVWISLACFIPGALVSFAIFRQSRFNSLEKLLIGFGLGMVIAPLIPFLLYFLAGIKFSYGIAILSVAAFYVAAIALFARSKAYEDFKLPQFSYQSLLSVGVLVAVLLVVIVSVSFLIRLSTYSPIFMELDPYYYTYDAQQLLVLGENPVNDKTAWYPVASVSHRIAPEISYLEATWYSLYTGGGQYDNMLLADIASVYPPIAGALAVFFIYIFISTYYRREWGILAAGLVAFIPIFLVKTVSGEMEVQPYAFFSIAFFLAMYAQMLKEKSRTFAVLAGLAFAAVALGSSSEILPATMVLLFLPLQAIFLYLKGEDASELRGLAENNAIMFLVGGVLGSMLVKGIFYNAALSFGTVIPMFIAVAVAGVMYIVRDKVAERKTRHGILAALVLVGLVLFLLTPLGNVVRQVGRSGIGVATFNDPLDRTIAEQNVASPDFSGEFGFVAVAYPSGLIASAFGITSDLVNFMLSVMVGIINWALNSDVGFSARDNSLLLLWVALFVAALVYSFYRQLKSEQAPSLLFAALIFPPLLVGLIKAKYTIYAGFLIAAVIAFIFGEAEDLLGRLAKNMGKDDAEKSEYVSYGYYCLAIIAGLLVILQFTASSGGIAPALLTSSFTTRFQDNPTAVAPKLQSICDTLTSKNVSESSICQQYSSAGVPLCTVYDPPVCDVASDPMKYADGGTNSQYSTKLCYYSLISDIMNPKSEEVMAANFRCQRINGYWIESMEWIRNNTEDGARITSWWDYGHWENFFGQRNAVIRNDQHVSPAMVGEVAHDYIDGTPEDLAAFMRSKGSKYALFDMELISGGGGFGGKYGALNYLSCARDNDTNVSMQPTMSQCEADHMWEVIFVPKDTTGRACTISKAGNKTGVLAYKAYWTWDRNTPFLYTPNYPNIMGYNCYGDYLNDPTTLAVCQNLVITKPAYCVGPVLLANGQTSYGTYLLNETYPNGDLKLNKAQFASVSSYQQTFHLGDVTAVTLVYTQDPTFLENGQVTSGYGDARTAFYTSNLYRALFINDIPGFTKVFETQDGMVKIYKVNN